MQWYSTWLCSTVLLEAGGWDSMQKQRISLAKKRYFFLQNLREIEKFGQNVKKY